MDGDGRIIIYEWLEKLNKELMPKKTPYTRYNDYRGPMYLLPESCMQEWSFMRDDPKDSPIIAVVGEYN